MVEFAFKMTKELDVYFLLMIYRYKRGTNIIEIYRNEYKYNVSL